MDRCTRPLFRQSLTGSQIGEPILPQTKNFALSFSCLRKGLATGIVIGGFGSGALFFAPSMNYLMSKFSVAPAFLGSSGVDLVTEGGRQFALVGDQLQEVVYASASELARLPFSGLAEGFYLVGSRSTAQCADCTVGSPSIEKALYLIQGSNRISMYFERNCGIKCQNPVVIQGDNWMKIKNLEFKAHKN